MTQLAEAATSYLDSLDADGVVRDRVHHFVREYEALLPEGALTSVFLSDQLDPDGDRQFESLWIIGKHLVAECSNVALQPRMEKWDLARWPALKHLVVESQDYSVSLSSRRSLLTVTWTTDNDLIGVMRATGKNTEHLTAVLKEHLLPRLPLNQV